MSGTICPDRVVRFPSCPVPDNSSQITASSCPPSDNSVDLNASSCPPSDNSASLGHDKLIPSYPLSIVPCRRTQKPFKSNDITHLEEVNIFFEQTNSPYYVFHHVIIFVWGKHVAILTFKIPKNPNEGSMECFLSNHTQSF